LACPLAAVAGRATVPAPKYVEPDNFAAAVAAIEERQKAYTEAAEELANLKPYYRMPVIGAAAAAVGVLVYTHNATTRSNWLAGLGITTGAYTRRS
jgi:hypothetical protein